MVRLTPRDIQEKEFRSGLRGYKEEEVDEFLDRVTSSYEEVFKENIDLKEEVERLLEENKKYELIGERMQAALVAAQETADDVRKNATKEAENILREAEIKAHKMVQESRDQHRELQKSLAIVKQIEEEFRFKLKSMLQSYLKLLDEVALGDAKEIRKWIPPEDMAALDERRKRLEQQEKAAKEEDKPKAGEKPASAEVTADRPVKAEDTAAKPAKADDTAARKVKAEDTKAKAAAILEEIAQQAAADKALQPSADLSKPAAASVTEGKPVQAEAPPPVSRVEDKNLAKPKAEEKKEESPPAGLKAAAKEVTEDKPAAEVSFDKETGKASAVAAEWDILQSAVNEAVKVEKSAEVKESKETKEPKVEEKKEAKKEESAAAEAPADKSATREAEAKPAKGGEKAKGGKVNLEDIEIVEDESFWKDI